MRWPILVVTLWIGSLLAACGAPTPQASTEGASPRQGKQISFMIFGDPAEKAAYESLAASFRQQHPDIDLQLIHIPKQDDYRMRLGVDFAGGTPADIVLINYRRMAGFTSKGALEPIGPYLAKSKVIKQEDFYGEVMRQFYWDGQLVCLPQNLSSLVVYYNKALFDQAGLAYPKDDWTWDDFLNTAKALTKDTNGDGTTDQYGVGTEVSLLRVAPFIWQNGGEIVDNIDAPTTLTLNIPDTKEALQWFVDLQVKHKVAPDAVQEESEDSETRFSNGRLGMYLNSRRVVPTLREIKDFDWDVAALPRQKQPASVLHADGYCIAAASKNKEAAWAFVEFANSPEGQTVIAKTGRTVPSLKAVAQSPAFLDPAAKPQNSRVFLDTIPSIRAVPIVPNWEQIEGTFSEELEHAFYGQISVDDVITNATSRTRDLFAR